MEKFATLHIKANPTKDFNTPRNRKRSLRWYSEETVLLKKYGSKCRRYIDLYVIDPAQVKI